MLALMPLFLTDLILQLHVVEPHERRHAHLINGDDIILGVVVGTSALLMNYSGSSLLRNGRILSTTFTFSLLEGSFLGVSGCDYFFIQIINIPHRQYKSP